LNMNKQGHGYSIWLGAKNRHNDAFSELINKFSRIFKSPIFEPHVTLLGDIKGNEKEILEKTKQLAEELHPYEIRTYEADHEPEYFRALFVHVKETPEVLRANKIAQKIFNTHKEYIPHLSLAYCTAPEKTKDEFTNEIKESLRGNGHFTARKLSLYETNGNVSDWKLIKTFRLR